MGRKRSYRWLCWPLDKLLTISYYNPHLCLIFSKKSWWFSKFWIVIGRLICSILVNKLHISEREREGREERGERERESIVSMREINNNWTFQPCKSWNKKNASLRVKVSTKTKKSMHLTYEMCKNENNRKGISPRMCKDDNNDANNGQQNDNGSQGD